MPCTVHSGQQALSVPRAAFSAVTVVSASDAAMTRKLRILALHSFRTSGKTFALQVSQLHRLRFRFVICRGVTLILIAVDTDAARGSR